MGFKVDQITQIHILVNKKYFSKDFLCKICVLVIAFYCNFFLGVLAENLRGLALFPLRFKYFPFSFKGRYFIV